MRFVPSFTLTAVLVASLVTQSVNAQFGPPGRIPANVSPDQVLREFVTQVQTGTPDASFIGPQLWQIIAAQTNNSGVYLPLVQIGKIQRVEVVARRDLPAGPVYSMKAVHTSGESNWIFGISNVSRKIEYASFGVNSAPPQSLPPQPEPSTPQSTSEACKKFPNLCPT